MNPRTLTQFRTLQEKALWMDAAASIDAADPIVQRIARLIVGDANAPRERADRLQRWVRDRIWYSRDPYGIEMTPDSRVTLLEGTEDCDGKARLLVALVRSLRDPRLDARLRSVWRGPQFTHAQAEIRAGDGPWRLAEVILRGVGVDDAPGASIETI